MSTGTAHPRDLQLDGVRGVAILLVMMLHLFKVQGHGDLGRVMNAVLNLGWTGVDLFFVLSGFLITRILVGARGGEHYFRNFYVRRTLRIFPAYYFCLLLLLVVLPPFHAELRESGIQDWSLWFVLYLQNFATAFQGQWPPWEGVWHLWSLAIEEQFYLVWPFVVWITPLRLLPRLCGAVVLAAFAGKLMLAALGEWRFVGYVHTLTRMDALAIGAWVACHRAAGGAELSRTVLLAGSAVLAAILLALVLATRGYMLTSAGSVAVGTTAVALLFGALIHHLTGPAPGRPLMRFFQGGTLRFFGRYSYGMYLIHLPLKHLLQLPMMGALQGALGPNLAMLASGVATALLTVVAALVMYAVVEAPALRLKDRYFELRAPRPVPG